jgi:predicted RNA-binding protein YlqC (UPF0109 family)
MKDFVKKIAQALVDNPEQVKVTVVEGKSISVIELEVAKDDIGKIIGKRGNTANAIRTLLNAISGKERKRVTLEIID